MNHRISVGAVAVAVAATAAVALPGGAPAADSPYAPASLVFIREAYPPGKTSSLQILDLVSGSARTLLEPGGPISDANVSPDGTQVAYNLFGKKGRSSLRVVSLDGTGDRVVVAGGARRAISHGEWTPDGTRLLYTAFPLTKKGVASPTARRSTPSARTGRVRRG